MLAEGRDDEQLAELDAMLAEGPGDKELEKTLKMGT
jgi:hypothetical protein